METKTPKNDAIGSPINQNSDAGNIKILPENDKKGLLKVMITEENGDLILYVKTSKDFEEWLKANKEIRTTESLFNLGQRRQFYYLRINNYFDIDDINNNLVYNGNINAGILRVVGISDGLKFNIGNVALMHKTKILPSIKQLIKAYSDFYNENIIKKQFSINAEVILC